jgi:hypothetical protein
MNEKIKRELTIWGQYFLISFISTSIAYSLFESSMRLGPDIDQTGSSNGSIEINVREMVLSMWNGYYRWWLFAFIGLSTVRFLILFLSNRNKEKTLE